MGKEQHKGGSSSTSRTTERVEKEGNFRKQTKIHDLLNSVKEDVVVAIPSESNETLDDEVQIDPSSLSIPHLSNIAFEQKNFMRVSPQKTSSHDNSRWRKAVQLSKVMMIRPLQSRARELKGNESDDDVEEESSIKMIGLLRAIDHSSCIASGILTGLLLWSTMSTMSWNYGTTTKNSNENFIRVYYSTIVILTYLTLTGFIIRLQRVPFSGTATMVGIYLLVALLAMLIFSCKGYELFRLECNIYHHHLSPEMKKKVLTPSICPRSTSSSSPQNNTDIEIIFVFITNVIQTISIFCLTCYFHFSSSWIFGNY